MILLPTGKRPPWLTAKAAKQIESVAETLLVTLGVPTAHIRYLCGGHAANALKSRRLPPLSLHGHPTSPINNDTNVVVIGVGKDSATDIVEAVISMSPEHITAFRAALKVQRRQSTPATVVTPPAQTAPVNETPAYDDTDLALFLDSIQNVGGEVTRVTAESIAAHLFKGELTIITAAYAAGVLTRREEFPHVISISPAGKKFLADSLKPASSATTPAPSEFDRLRAEVLRTRQVVEELQEQHNQHASRRTTATNDLSFAKKDLSESEQKVKKLKEQLAAAEDHTAKCRAHVIRNEQLLATLPDHSAALAEAQLTYECARRAYSDFTQI